VVGQVVGGAGLPRWPLFCVGVTGRFYGGMNDHRSLTLLDISNASAGWLRRRLGMENCEGSGYKASHQGHSNSRNENLPDHVKPP
jgi:hypothetical protein